MLVHPIAHAHLARRLEPEARVADTQDPVGVARVRVLGVEVAHDLEAASPGEAGAGCTTVCTSIPQSGLNQGNGVVSASITISIAEIRRSGAGRSCSEETNLQLELARKPDVVLVE